MKIIREEIFGPVCAVIKFKTEQEVIDLANDTVYGLSSAVWSRNISRAVRVAHALEAGQAYVSLLRRDDCLPAVTRRWVYYRSTREACQLYRYLSVATSSRVSVRSWVRTVLRST